MKTSVEGLHVVYVATSPTNQPRMEKIRKTLTKHGAHFTVFKPRLTLNIPVRPLRALVNYALFLLQTVRVKGDVVWVSNCPDISALSFAIIGRSYVYDYRSPWSREVAIEFGHGLYFRGSELIEKIARRHSSVIVTVSKRMVKDVAQLGVPVYVVPNYPFRSFSATVDRVTFRRIRGIPEDAKVAIFVGRLTRIEGADLLGGVADGIAKLGDSVLWIVGDGPLREYVKSLERNYPGKVTYFGWVPHDEVPNYIAAADVSIMPRHKNPNAEYYSEEGVHKISESLCLGTPVVASSAARSEYYVSVEEDEFVDALVRFLRSPRPVTIGTPRWEDVSEGSLLQSVSEASRLRRRERM